jgi:hypothetical protein
MADYYTQFSCLLDVNSTENVTRALEIYERASNDDEEFPLSAGFVLSPEEEGETKLWIRDDISGDPECVIQFVLMCAEVFDLKGLWGFEYSNGCSKHRLEAFGGGAHVIDLTARKSVGWISTNEWLYCALQGEDPDA